MKNKVSILLRLIKHGGDSAIVRLLKRWDGVSLPPSRFAIPMRQAQSALRRLPRDKRKILELSARRISEYHKKEKRHITSSWMTSSNGLRLGQRVTPVDSVGIYVPGGRFAYPSTVLMTAIPARIAGVGRLVMATPPRHMTDDVLAAAVIAGVDTIYQVGGIAAVGALAYGTESIPRVDLIVGPGGIWVTEAKRQIYGDSGIDMLAGPSEIVIFADDGASIAHIAADMMAQTEHDPAAKAYLLSTDPSLITAVRNRIEGKYRPQCQFIRVKDMTGAARQINKLAPEHLSLNMRRPERFLPRIKNAGAIFLGAFSPVACGDYWAGPSHVLPTGRAARFSSGLSVQTFLKRSSVIGVSPGLLKREGDRIARFAEMEGLRFHALSIRTRIAEPK
ncbi:MAG TPA: histidinol dehydrogenase [Elusimicrobiota bacterium]|nr:histidinol dehydrogenase [Elusimicrobiota bacterium]